MFSVSALQVRLGAIKEDGRVATRQLARHRGRAHKLALDPLHPACFYSSGEDGAVLYFDTREAPRTSHAARPLLSITTRGGSAENAVRGWRAAAAQREFPLEVNAITVNPARPWQLAVGEWIFALKYHPYVDWNCSCVEVQLVSSGTCYRCAPDSWPLASTG